MKIFFNSSMPRSGSTLLQNVMGQNPEFYVTSTSGVLELLFGARLNFTKSPEFKANDHNLMEVGFSSFCKNGLEGFYSKITNSSYVIDKSRGWAINYNFLNSFYPNPRIICMVRDLRSIVASMEKIEQSQALYDSEIVDNAKMEGITLYKRIEKYLSKPPIGLAVSRMSEIISQKWSSNILFVKYEDFCLNPTNTLKTIYQYLNVKYYEQHNFNNVKQITFEDDEIYGIRNLHKVKPIIEPSKNYFLEILGQDLSDRLYNTFEWYFNFFKYEK